MLKILILVLCVIVAAPSWSFGKIGHQLVCQTAFAHMTPKAQSKVTAIAKRAGYRSFAESCSWADAIKKKSRYDFAKPHHYLNVGRHQLKLEKNHQCGSKGCVLEAIDVYQRLLQQQSLTKQEAKLYSLNKNEAVLFLAHFVGDIHQPMHVSYADDLGGNKYNIRYQGDRISLHWLWDGVLLNPCGYPKPCHAPVPAISSEQRQRWSQLSILDWANESLSITRTIYQQVPKTKRITSSYISNNQPVVIERIQMAGIRLAFLLNQIYD